MAATLYALVRFFKQESHREDFLRGNLYMNRLKYFRQYEEQDKCNIGDRHEGLTGWLQPEDVKMTIEDNETGETFKIEGLAGPLRLGYHHHDEYHVYCMSALYCNDDSAKTLEMIRSEAMLDVDKGDLGDYCSVIFGLDRFFSRVDSTLDGLTENRSNYGLVEYYDPNTFSGTFKGDEAFLRKASSFSHQREFRIFAWDGSKGNDARTLNIGDLSDIVFNCHKSELNKLVSLDIPVPVLEP
jgi:hypothetical protein